MGCCIVLEPKPDLGVNLTQKKEGDLMILLESVARGGIGGFID